MSPLRVVITGCSDEEFRTFAMHAIHEEVVCRGSKDNGLVCLLPPELLETLFKEMQTEAKKAWENPDRNDALHFDSAFFPSSVERVQPVRQLRGLLSARLDRKKLALPPAYASPGFVFGTAVDD